MKKYEIKTVICDVAKLAENKEVKQLGAKGWSLVNVVPQMQSGLSLHVAIFQKEIKENYPQ